MKGIVVKNTGYWYTVKTDGGRMVESKIKGNFRLKGIRSTNPVAVGDRVKIVVNEEGTAFITEIEDRRNYIIRKSQNLSKQSHILAANVDQAFLLVTVSHPQTSTTFVDRFLASAEAYRVPVVLIFNKNDLLNEEELRCQSMMVGLYEAIGYECRVICAADGSGVGELCPLLRDKVTLLSGNSGVGKSTLLNLLIPDAHARVAEISEAHDDLFRDARCAGWRLSYRHAGYQRIRYFRHGAGRNHELFQGDIPVFTGVPFQQLHAYPRAWLRRAPGCGEPSHRPLAL